LAISTKTGEETCGKHENVADEGDPAEDFDGVDGPKDEADTESDGDVDFPGVAETGNRMA
jgi:hypothetical protein